MDQAIVNSLVFSGIGIVVLVVAFFVIDWMNSSYHLWNQIIEKQNIALAILMGAFTIAIGLIIAAAVRG
jgi:putative membrane protein